MWLHGCVSLCAQVLEARFLDINEPETLFQVSVCVRVCAICVLFLPASASPSVSVTHVL